MNRTPSLRNKPLCRAVVLAALPILTASLAAAQTCTTQSQMQPAERVSVAAAALRLAQAVEANDPAAIKALTIPEFAASFSGVAEVISSTAPHLAGGKPEVEQVYLMDASAAKAPADTQFFCTLNHSMAEADFSIPQLPPGRYAFSMVRVSTPHADSAPWRLSFLLRQEESPQAAASAASGARWLLAGIYPRALSASGHEGLWYWTQARAMNAGKQPWDAWLYFQEAQSLLQPAAFVSSTHLEKLALELAAAAPPTVKGIGPEAPLVVKGPEGQEFRFTSISVDDSLGREKVDIAAHFKVDSLGDAALARQRNLNAMAALVDAHPELRTAFHGVWIFADPPGQSPYGTEAAMPEIH